MGKSKHDKESEKKKSKHESHKSTQKTSGGSSCGCQPGTKCTHSCPSVSIPSASCPTPSSVSIPSIHISAVSSIPSVHISSLPTSDASCCPPTISNCFSCGKSDDCSCTRSKKSTKQSKKTASCDSSSSDEDIKLRTSDKCKFAYPSVVVRRGKKGEKGGNGNPGSCGCLPLTAEKRLRVPGFFVIYASDLNGTLTRTLDSVVAATLNIQQDGSEVTVSVYADDPGVSNVDTNTLTLTGPFVLFFQETLVDFDFFSLSAAGFKIPVRDHMSSAYCEVGNQSPIPTVFFLRDLRLTITKRNGHLLLTLANGTVNGLLDTGVITVLPLNSVVPLLTYTEAGAEIDDPASPRVPHIFVFNRSYSTTYVPLFAEFFVCPVVGSDPAVALQSLIDRLRNYILATSLQLLGIDAGFIQAQVDALVNAFTLLVQNPVISSADYQTITNAGSLSAQFNALQAYLTAKGLSVLDTVNLSALFGLAPFKNFLQQLLFLPYTEFLCAVSVFKAIPKATFKATIAAIVYPLPV